VSLLKVVDKLQSPDKPTLVKRLSFTPENLEVKTILPKVTHLPVLLENSILYYLFYFCFLGLHGIFWFMFFIIMLPLSSFYQFLFVSMVLFLLWPLLCNVLTCFIFQQVGVKFEMIAYGRSRDQQDMIENARHIVGSHRPRQLNL